MEIVVRLQILQVGGILDGGLNSSPRSNQFAFDFIHIHKNNWVIFEQIK